MINRSAMLSTPDRRLGLGCLVLFAVALLASACGTSDARTSYETDSARTSSTPVVTATSTVSDQSNAVSPLFALVGVPLDSDEAIDDYYDQLFNQAERLTTECMVARGFQYTPFDYSHLADAADVAFVDRRQYAEEFGFGIATLEEPNDAASEFVDPNAAYLETLTEGEYAAFDRALYGARGEGAERSGCQNEAFDEAFSFFVVIDEFGYDFEAIAETVKADPRILDAHTRWHGCMARAGYTFADSSDARSYILDRLEAILGDGAGVSGDTLRPDTERQIDQLAIEERAIAVASWDCNAPIRDLQHTVEREAEQRFVDKHGSAIRVALGT